MAKISCSLPDELVADLDKVSQKMGITRSALIAALLRDGASTLARVLDESGFDKTLKDDPEKMRRAVTGALDSIVGELKELQEHVGTAH